MNVTGFVTGKHRAEEAGHDGEPARGIFPPNSSPRPATAFSMPCSRMSAAFDAQPWKTRLTRCKQGAARPRFRPCFWYMFWMPRMGVPLASSSSMKLISNESRCGAIAAGSEQHKEMQLSKQAKLAIGKATVGHAWPHPFARKTK